MLIEFEIRAFDCRVFEAWQAAKYLAAGRFFRGAVWLSVFAGLALWYRYPNAFGLSGNLTFLVIPLSLQLLVIAAAFLTRTIQAYRYREVHGLAEGHHSLHFSKEGVHHVGPRGVGRYPWTAFSGLEIGFQYLFLRFEQPGSVIIPVAAIEKFGPAYEQAFLAELAALVREGRGASE
jgi:hypothetical protein